MYLQEQSTVYSRPHPRSIPRSRILGLRGLTTIGAGEDLAAAASRLRPGDTLQLGGGTYTQGLINAIPGGSSWSAPVTIEAAPGARPILRPRGGTSVIWFGDASQRYIVLKNLVIDASGVERDGIKITYSDGNNKADCAHHIRVAGCEITGARNQGIYVGAANYGGDNEFLGLNVHHNGVDHLTHGIYVTGSRNLIQDCVFASNAGYGVHLYDSADEQVNNNIVRRNRIYNNGNFGIVASSGSGSIIERNLIYSNRAGGVQVSHHSVRNVQIVLNTIVDNSGPGILLTSADTANENHVVEKNIISGNSGGAIQNSSKGTRIQGNCENPEFSDNDFHTRAGSCDGAGAYGQGGASLPPPITGGGGGGSGAGSGGGQPPPGAGEDVFGTPGTSSASSEIGVPLLVGGVLIAALLLGD